MEELVRVVRFLIVGVLNTGIGYAIILAGLALGLGDYAANATGFALGVPISWMMHRIWTFEVKHAARLGEALRYAGAVGTAYFVNLGVLFAGRSLGYQENPLVQLCAIGAYAAVMFLIARAFVFTAHPATE